MMRYAKPEQNGCCNHVQYMAHAAQGFWAQHKTIDLRG